MEKSLIKCLCAIISGGFATLRFFALLWIIHRLSTYFDFSLCLRMAIWPDNDSLKIYCSFWIIGLVLIIVGIIKENVELMKAFQALITFDIATEIYWLTIVFHCPDWEKNLVPVTILIILALTAITGLQMIKNVINTNSGIVEIKMNQENEDEVEKI